jgi:hypothetical protein
VRRQRLFVGYQRFERCRPGALLCRTGMMNAYKECVCFFLWTHFGVVMLRSIQTAFCCSLIIVILFKSQVRSLIYSSMFRAVRNFAWT